MATLSASFHGTVIGDISSATFTIYILMTKGKSVLHLQALWAHATTSCLKAFSSLQTGLATRAD